MAPLFRKKNKIQVVGLAGSFVTAVYQPNDFPTIDLILTVEEQAYDKKGRPLKRSDITEITVSMTIFEANELLKKFQLIVTNTTRLVTPRNAINIPWGEG